MNGISPAGHLQTVATVCFRARQNIKVVMKHGLPALLIVASLPAYASGETSAVFAGLVPLLVVGCTVILVLIAKANWQRKLRAMVPAAFALGIEIALGFFPDYERNAKWLVPLCMAVACSGGLLAWRSIARLRARDGRV